jgi:4-hydroxy-tetrahydrodipicolinate synthase
MTGAPLSLDLIARLRKTFPGAILGVKDSACDPDATMRLIDAHGDLTILVGDETYLGRACAAGAQGSICGLANIAPEAVIEVMESGRDDPRIKRLIDAIGAYPVIPMVKALVGYVRIDPAWARACPPLPSVDEDAIRRVAPFVKELQAARGAAA